MSNPFGNKNDVENGNGDFTIDDDSTLQPPPPYGSNVDSDDFDHVNMNGEHDQLPSPEEYKAKMTDHRLSSTNSARFVQFSPSKEAAEASEAGSVYGDDHSVAMHDQLPNVDEYKAASQQRRQRGFRAGFWTFVILFVVTVIITAVTIPLVSKSQEQQTSASNANSGGSTGSGSSTDSSPPQNEAEATRLQEVIDYLVHVGVTSRTKLEEDQESPQYKAANWIANGDAYQIPVPSGVGFDIIHSPLMERYTLAVLYYALGGDSWKYSMRFMEPRDHCEWYQDFVTTSGNILRLGVSECKVVDSGSQDKFVHGLQLPNNGLNGNFPLEIQLLHRLTKLVLSFNADLKSESSLEGLRGLENLSDLELQYCSLSGELPDWFGDLRSLTNLGLGNNAFVGQLPDSFFLLTNLNILGLDDNKFGGPIAPFAALSNLSYLYLEDNLFSGELTESLFSAWNKMEELDLSFNKLDGPLPSNIWSISGLEVLDLHGNKFVGVIPEISTPHENLIFLALHENKLDWRLPETISNLQKLAHLDVSQNNLELPFPSTMSELTHLRYLFTGHNPFEDHLIPDFLLQMTALRELSMKNNSLTGGIPTFIGNMTRLQVLDLGMNKLQGQIPEEFGQLTGLDTLLLNRNNLDGSIPESFALLNDLDNLLLDGNEFDGTADVICSTPSINVTRFIADCAAPNPEIACSCCTLCCDDSNTTCNNFDWNINLDPIWEYGYERVVYSFTQNVLPPGDEGEP